MLPDAPLPAACWAALWLLSSACSTSSSSPRETPLARAPSCSQDSECDDGLVCSGLERCVDGRCWAGLPPRCGDGDSCTEDLCLEPFGCSHLQASACAPVLLGPAARPDAGSGDGGYISRLPDFCGEKKIVGNVTITTSEALAQLSEVRCIDGDVLLTGPELHSLLPLASLRWIGGSLRLRNLSAITSLAGLDALEEVHGALEISELRGALSLAPFASLKLVRGDLQLRKLLRVERLAGFDSLTRVEGTLEVDIDNLEDMNSAFMSLTDVEETLSIKGSKLTRLDAFNALTNVPGVLIEAKVEQLAGFRRLESLTSGLNLPAQLLRLRGFDRLREAGSISVVSDNLQSIAAFSSLEKVSELTLGSKALSSLQGFEALESAYSLTLSGLPDLGATRSFARLTEVVKLTVQGTQLHTLPFVALRQCADLNLSDNPLLSDLSSLGALEQEPRGLNIQVVRNPALGSLRAVGQQRQLGTVLIRENRALTELAWAEITRVSGPIAIVANPQLSRCEVDLLLGKLPTTSTTAIEVCCNSGCQQCQGASCTVGAGSSAGQSEHFPFGIDKDTDLASLTHVASTSIVYLEDYSGPATPLPSLRTVTHDLAVYRGTLSTPGSFVGLEEVGRDLIFESCPELVSMAGLERLRRVGGTLKVSNNQALRSVSLPGLETIGSRFRASWNPLVSSCQLAAVEAQLSAPPAYVELGNNDQCVREGVRGQCASEDKSSSRCRLPRAHDCVRLPQGGQQAPPGQRSGPLRGSG